MEQQRIDAIAPIGEDLTIDVALWGNLRAHKMIVISSGLHGVEGFFGSAVQLAHLRRWIGLAQYVIHLTYDFILAEFGTHSILRVLKAMRAENRAHWWGEAETQSYQWAKQQLLEAFLPRRSRWRDRVLKQGIDLCLQLLSTDSLLIV
jgi:hypothetical protein